MWKDIKNKTTSHPQNLTAHNIVCFCWKIVDRESPSSTLLFTRSEAELKLKLEIHANATQAPHTLSWFVPTVLGFHNLLLATDPWHCFANCSIVSRLMGSSRSVIEFTVRFLLIPPAFYFLIHFDCLFGSRENSRKSEDKLYYLFYFCVFSFSIVLIMWNGKISSTFFN